MAEEPSAPAAGISSSPDGPVIRILLMGRKGSGKSLSGNTILGEKKFKAPKRKNKNEAEVTQIGEKLVHVIDPPDLLDPGLNKEKLEMLKEQLVSGCSAGLSSVLLTVPLEKPLGNEEEMLDYIKCLLGPEVQKYIMILFTRGDKLEDLDETIDEYLQHKDHEDLQRLVTECGGKCLCFNNKRKSEDQTQKLLQKIEGMVMENGGIFIMEQMKRSVSKDRPGVNFSGGFPADETVEIPGKKDQISLVPLGKNGFGKSFTIIDRSPFRLLKQCYSETKLLSVI